MDYDQILNTLKNVDWNEFATYNIDTCLQILYTKIMATADNLCPLKELTFSKDKPICLTHDLIVLMKNRDSCLKLYAIVKKEEDKIPMRLARNTTNMAVKAVRADYIKEQLETHRYDPKTFWKNISDILPNKRSIV